jgi:endonuclease/exonuclease/phosphatase (EEP) superfamily protein YafD
MEDGMIIRFFAILTSLGLVGGLVGAWHPIGDSLAVFRLYLAGALGILGVVMLIGDRKGALVALLTALGFGGPLVWQMANVPHQGSNLRLYQKNILFRNDDLAALETDIRASRADVVTLQEVSEPNLILLSDLKDMLPHQHFCPFAAVGGVAMLSAFDPIPNQRICAKGMAAMQVNVPDNGPVWLISIHLHWPWPYGQAAHVNELLPVLEGLEGPVIMAGDFNMVRWSSALARMRDAVGAEQAGPVRMTYPLVGGWVPIGIDHVLGPKGGAVETRPSLGSDHLGLLADMPL